MDDKILDAALTLAARQGWETMTLADIAHEAQLSLSDLRAQAEDKSDIVRALFARIDAAMLQSTNFEGSPKDRLFDLFMARFDALNAHRAGFVSILNAFKSAPADLIRALPGLCSSMRWVAEGAGLYTNGWRAEGQNLALVFVYLNALRAWKDDNSADLAATMASVDKELTRVQGFLA